MEGDPKIRRLEYTLSEVRESRAIYERRYRREKALGNKKNARKIGKAIRGLIKLEKKIDKRINHIRKLQNKWVK